MAPNYINHLKLSKSAERQPRTEAQFTRGQNRRLQQYDLKADTNNRTVCLNYASRMSVAEHC
jgi:hypothetical protein